MNAAAPLPVPDPVTDSYGYMVWSLWRIFHASLDIRESEEVLLARITALARDALSAAGEDM